MILGLLWLVAFQGCITRPEVNAEIWLHTGLPADICALRADISTYGIYRQLNDGQYEFLSYCKPEVVDYVLVNGVKFKAILDELLPEPGKANLVKNSTSK